MMVKKKTKKTAKGANNGVGSAHVPDPGLASGQAAPANAPESTQTTDRGEKVGADAPTIEIIAAVPAESTKGVEKMDIVEEAKRTIGIAPPPAPAPAMPELQVSEVEKRRLSFHSRFNAMREVAADINANIGQMGSTIRAWDMLASSMGLNRELLAELDRMRAASFEAMTFETTSKREMAKATAKIIEGKS